MTEPLTEKQLRTWRKWHELVPINADDLSLGWRCPTCGECELDAPCETWQLLEEVDRLRALVEKLTPKTPYPWCRNKNKQECADRGWCNRDPNCGE